VASLAVAMSGNFGLWSSSQRLFIKARARFSWNEEVNLKSKELRQGH
jgi:hypothetical protein